MSTLTLFDDSLDTAPPAYDAHARIGFELGWDYAHYRLAPPAPYEQAPSALHDGLLAGRAAFGLRTLQASRHVRKWLQLRLHAWLRGRSVELFQVTPNYLAQIDVAHCPITRVELSAATLEPTDASIDRVRNDAGYAAGNLVVMSTKANHAKAAAGYRDAQRLAQRVADEALPGLAGLTGEQWSRVAVLCSFVEPLPHDDACGVPLLVLPPNRLRLFNPVQALQAFVSRQLLRPGWSQRVSRIEDLLAGKALKHDFKSFFMALLPRVLEAGKLTEPHEARWAVEDAWRAPLVQQRWARFARQLTPAQCTALIAKATARRLGTGATVIALPDERATDGWNLATRGYEAPGAPGAAWADPRGARLRTGVRPRPRGVPAGMPLPMRRDMAQQSLAL